METDAAVRPEGQQPLNNKEPIPAWAQFLTMRLLVFGPRYQAVSGFCPRKIIRGPKQGPQIPVPKYQFPGRELISPAPVAIDPLKANHVFVMMFLSSVYSL